MDSRPSGAGRTKTGIIWALSLVATAAIVFFAATRLPDGTAGRDGSPSMRRQLLLSDMRLNLARAAELEKCAVLSERDEESANFSEESKSASATVERDLGKLRKLIGEQGSAKERELLGKFERSWKQLKQIDAPLLLVAPQNTNIKALELSGTIGAELLQKFHDDLAKAAQKTTPVSKRIEMEKLAAQAENAVQGIAILQMQHIHTLSAPEKAAIEAPMNAAVKHAESRLKSMEAVSGRKSNGLLGNAATVLGEILQLNEEIVRLSKIDSNAGSAEVSLGTRRMADTECDRLLRELQSESFRN